MIETQNWQCQSTQLDERIPNMQEAPSGEHHIVLNLKIRAHNSIITIGGGSDGGALVIGKLQNHHQNNSMIGSNLNIQKSLSNPHQNYSNSKNPIGEATTLNCPDGISDPMTKIFFDHSQNTSHHPNNTNNQNSNF